MSKRSPKPPAIQTVQLPYHVRADGVLVVDGHPIDRVERRADHVWLISGDLAVPISHADWQKIMLMAIGGLAADPATPSA